MNGSPTWSEDMDACKQNEDKNPDSLHGDPAAENSSDFFVGLQPSGQWKRCPSSGRSAADAYFGTSFR